MNNYYVYKWQDINNSDVIYVGQGHGRRYKETRRKNCIFEEYIRTHECVPIIIKEGLSEKESILWESVYVKFYKNIGQCTCVRTSDGYRSMPKETNPNYKNGEVLRQRYISDPMLKNKTKHIGASNGRSRKIQMIFKSQIFNFDCILDCAIYMRNNGISKGSTGTIQSAISKNIRLNKSYCNAYFKYLD